jgi:hypothetical protein
MSADVGSFSKGVTTPCQAHGDSFLLYRLVPSVDLVRLEVKGFWKSNKNYGQRQERRHRVVQTLNILAPSSRCNDAKTPIDGLVERSQIAARDKKTDHRS